VGRDEAAINEADLPKPVKPKPVTDLSTKQMIEAKYNEIRRLPGESNVRVDLMRKLVVCDSYFQTLFNCSPNGPAGARSHFFFNFLNIEITGSRSLQ
jgi:hypothetical protein